MNRLSRPSPEPSQVLSVGQLTAAPLVSVVVMQHLEEAVHLRHLRSRLVRAPDARLLQLDRLDERLAAHLDGLSVAREDGTGIAREVLEPVGTGEIFVSAVRAIELRDSHRLDVLLDVAQAVPPCRAGLISAFGWASPADLRGITQSLLETARPWRREVGLAACALHGVDPGPVLVPALHASHTSLRACALRGAGRCGRRDLLEACLEQTFDADENCAFEAARAALLLGDRAGSISALESIALAEGGNADLRLAALQMVVRVLEPERTRSILAALAKRPQLIRTVIRGVADSGDPHYLSWLVAQMDDPRLARLAGEAFSLITGLELATVNFERMSPESVDSGPNDDPDDEIVAMDDDDGLPWPDATKIAVWWKMNGVRFAVGTRYFMGQVPTPATCLEVLKSGFQRQRISAAQWLALLAPGTPLFNTSAPSWRQRRALMRMTA